MEILGLILDDLTIARDGVLIDLYRRIPEVRPHHAFAAMNARRRHGNDERRRGKFPPNRTGREYIIVQRDRGSAFDAQGFLAAGHEEEKSDLRILHDRRKGGDLLVSGPVGNHERVVVEHLNEPWRVPLRRNRRLPRRVRRRDAHERRKGNKRPVVLVQPGLVQCDGDLERRPIVRA